MAKKPTYEELEQRIKELENETVKCKQEKKARRERQEKNRLLTKTTPDIIILNDM